MSELVAPVGLRDLPQDAHADAPDRVIAGTLVRIDGMGVLLTGDSGAGKSDTALGLLDRGHGLVADDAVRIYPVGSRLWGTAPAELAGLLAIRGLGVLDVGALFGPQARVDATAVDLIIHLDSRLPPPVDPLAVRRDSRTIMAAPLPRLSLPATRARDLALLVETAARSHGLQEQGHTPQEAFIAQQRRALARGAS